MKELEKRVNELENYVKVTKMLFWFFGITGAVILGLILWTLKTTTGFATTANSIAETKKGEITAHADTIVKTKVEEILSPEKIELIEAVANPGWTVLEDGRTGPSFFKDQLGFVHLFGFLAPTNKFDPKNVFTLPLGFRPKETLQFPIACGEREDGTQLRTCSVTIRPDDGGVAAESFSEDWNSLNGVTFLAAPQ